MKPQDEYLYNVYFNLGAARTIAKVARETGVSKDSLYRLSSKYNWKARAIEDSHKGKVSVLGESDSESVLSEISRDSLLKLHDAVKTLRPSSARDAKALLDIYLLISGRATVITENKADSSSELLSFLLEILTPEQLERAVAWASVQEIDVTN